MAHPGSPGSETGAGASPGGGGVPSGGRAGGVGTPGVGGGFAPGDFNPNFGNGGGGISPNFSPGFFSPFSPGVLPSPLPPQFKLPSNLQRLIDLMENLEVGGFKVKPKRFKQGGGEFFGLEFTKKF